MWIHLVITNAGDPSVDNVLTAQVVASWREWGTEVATYEFSADLQLDHDLIDPSKGTQPVVYPRLIDLITKHEVTRKGGAYKD